MSIISSFHEKLYNRGSAHTTPVAPAAPPRHRAFLAAAPSAGAPPDAQGKIHIWVGDADDFFFNNAVHQLDEFLSRAQPAYEGSITYGHGHGHCWMGTSEREMMQ